MEKVKSAPDLREGVVPGSPASVRSHARNCRLGTESSVDDADDAHSHPGSDTLDIESVCDEVLSQSLFVPRPCANCGCTFVPAIHPPTASEWADSFCSGECFSTLFLLRRDMLQQRARLGDGLGGL